MREIIDLGDGHTIRFIAFHPDRSIPANAERFRDIPDDERAGAIVAHTSAQGRQCECYIGLNPSVSAPSFPWRVVSWDPLTLEPSLLCRCGDHGFVRDGKWVPA